MDYVTKISMTSRYDWHYFLLHHEEILQRSLHYTASLLYIVGNLQLRLTYAVQCLQQFWQPHILFTSLPNAHRIFNLKLVLIYRVIDADGGRSWPM